MVFGTQYNYTVSAPFGVLDARGHVLPGLLQDLDGVLVLLAALQLRRPVDQALVALLHLDELRRGQPGLAGLPDGEPLLLPGVGVVDHHRQDAVPALEADIQRAVALRARRLELSGYLRQLDVLGGPRRVVDV